MRVLSWTCRALRICNESLGTLFVLPRFSSNSPVPSTRPRLFANSFATTSIGRLHGSEKHLIQRGPRLGKYSRQIEGRKQFEAQKNEKQDTEAAGEGDHISASNRTSFQRPDAEHDSNTKATVSESIEAVPAGSDGNIKSKSVKRRVSAEANENPSSSRAAKLEKATEHWQLQKEALQSKFGDEGWNPRKKLSPDAMEGIRAMNAQYPEQFTTPVLAEQFGVSPEAIRRILKSKWRPSANEAEQRNARWDRRGERIWSKLADMGLRPPKKWREMGVGKAKGGQAPKWSRQYKRSRHPENIYDMPRKAGTAIARRYNARDVTSAVPRQSFVDRIR